MPEKSRLANVRLAMIFMREGHNPRTDYGQGDGTLAALADSIKEKGMIHPPLVRAADPARQRYYIVAGHRRIAAAKHLKLEVLTCTCLDWLPEAEAAREDLLLAMVENLQRKALDPIELAQGYKRLIAQGYKQLDIALMVGVTQATISQTLSLLQLPAKIQEQLRSGEISKSTGEELRPLVRAGLSAKKIEQVASVATGEGLRHREVRELVHRQLASPEAQLASPEAPTPASSSRPADLYSGLTEEQLVRWAVKEFGSLAKALADLKRRIEGKAS